MCSTQLVVMPRRERIITYQIWVLLQIVLVVSGHYFFYAAVFIIMGCINCRHGLFFVKMVGMR